MKLKEIFEEKWSGNVHTEWHPPEGFFEQPPEKIASGLRANSKNLKQAMSRLNFYINRAGSNLSTDDQARLEKAKMKLKGMFGED